jgi:hypothetical protein
MLHIAESVPSPESVPSNSGNSGLIQPMRLSRQRSSSMQAIPEFRLALTLILYCVVKYNCLEQASDSGAEFRELGRSGIRRNSVRFRSIPELDGISELLA